MGIKVIYTNENGGSLEFSKDTGVHITAFDSLSSNSVTFGESTPYSKVGSIYTSNSVSARTFSITGTFKKDAEIRKKLIEAVAPGVTATLRYIDEDDDIDVYWTGQPAKTPDIGWTNWWQEFQFTFKAFYPYARDTNSTQWDFQQKTALFKFPATFPSDTASDGYLFSTATNYSNCRIDRDQVNNSGMLILAKVATENLKEFMVYNYYGEYIQLSGLEDIDIGNTIEISTYQNDIYARVKETGQNLMSKVNPYSTFLQLKPGRNYIYYNTNVGTVVVQQNIENIELTIQAAYERVGI